MIFRNQYRQCRKALTVLTYLFLTAALAMAQGMQISQISTDGLLTKQETRLYVSAPGLPADLQLDKSMFEVWESSDGADWEKRPIRAFSKSPNVDEGISFLMLIDNSGSMWDDEEGKPTEIPADTRIAKARDAARDFITSLSPKDRLGLVIFNTRYLSLLETGSEAKDALALLDRIERPSAEDAYTELYLSIERALDAFAGEAGRKAIIVLSDGENWPYSIRTGNPSPEFGSNQTNPDSLSDLASKNGISIYSIRFGADRDPLVANIARESGGQVFDAMDGDELSSVYHRIQEDVLSEFAVTYKAGMMPGEKRHVRIKLVADEQKKLEAARYYYSGNLLGQSSGLRLEHILFALAALLLWLALVLFKLEKETDRTGVRLLFSPGGTSTKFFELSGPQTVIGGDLDADVSIAGNPSLKSSHATILFDEKQNAYTVVADSPLTVNNRTVSKKRLESGDVINMAGTVVVFDQALMDASRADKTGSTGKPAKTKKDGLLGKAGKKI